MRAIRSSIAACAPGKIALCCLSLRLRAVSPSPGVWPAIERRIGGSSRSGWRALAAAVALVAVLGFGWIVWQELRPPQATAVLATESGATLWQVELAAEGDHTAAAPPCRRRGCPRRAWPACRARCWSRRSRLWDVARTTRPLSTPHVVGEQQFPAGRPQPPCRASISGIDRWSATENIRISATSSAQNSTRTGCSAVGGRCRGCRRAPRNARLADHVDPRVCELHGRAMVSSNEIGPTGG